MFCSGQHLNKDFLSVLPPDFNKAKGMKTDLPPVVKGCDTTACGTMFTPFKPKDMKWAAVDGSHSPAWGASELLSRFLTWSLRVSWGGAGAARGRDAGAGRVPHTGQGTASPTVQHTQHTATDKLPLMCYTESSGPTIIPAVFGLTLLCCTSCWLATAQVWLTLMEIKQYPDDIYSLMSLEYWRTNWSRLWLRNTD